MARSEAGNVAGVVEITAAVVAGVVFVFVLLPKLMGLLSSHGVTSGASGPTGQTLAINGGSPDSAQQYRSFYGGSSNQPSDYSPYSAQQQLSQIPGYDGGGDPDTVASYADQTYDDAIDPFGTLDDSGDGTGSYDDGSNDDSGGF